MTLKVKKWSFTYKIASMHFKLRVAIPGATELALAKQSKVRMSTQMILLPYKKRTAQKFCAVFNSGDRTSLRAGKKKKAREKTWNA